VRGRPKRNPRRRAMRNCHGRRRAELSLRVGADGPKNWLGNTVWRIKRRPVWNMSGGAGPPVGCCWLSRRRSARLKSEVDPSGSGYGRTVAQNRPLRRECLGSDATWAKNRPSLRPRGSRWLWEGRKNAGIVQKRSVPALHREAERDTTGSNSRQHPVHTWIGQSVQGKRRGPATLILIHELRTKMPLTSR
jgi:hypothetical protein